MVLPSIGGNLPAGIILTHPAPRLARPVHRRGAGAKTVNGRGKRLGLIGISLLIALLVVCPPACGEMRRVWEVQLGKKIIEPAGWQSLKYHALQSLAFSADSRWLAVTID